jgi:hypothetical protein
VKEMRKKNDSISDYCYWGSAGKTPPRERNYGR